MFFGSKKEPLSREALIDELLSRSVVEIIPSKDSLRKDLVSGKRLRIKLGIDPTSPHLHLGRSVALLKMLDFQKLGHHIIPIVGDFTGVIGDTSDKESERPMLSAEEIERNKKKYFEQAGKIINIKKADPRYNSTWLSKLGYHDIGEQADQFSVSDFISRELIKKRIDDGKRVSLREVLYPLMQGYDSVAIKADVEIGGTDQRFNLLAGRTLQEHYEQPPQHVIVIGPLIPGTDGRKMSSSWGNTINLDDEAHDMFGKVMSIPDNLTETYFIHTTRVPIKEIQTFMKGHPKDAKMALAKELVRMYHGEKDAEHAKANFEKTFSKGEIPDDIKEIHSHGSLKDTLVKNGIVASNSEFTRLLVAKAIHQKTGEEDIKVIDGNAPALVGVTYRIGKHRFVKVIT